MWPVNILIYASWIDQAFLVCKSADNQYTKEETSKEQMEASKEIFEALRK